MRIDFTPRLQMTMAIVAAGVGLVSAGAGFYTGIKQRQQAKKLLEKQQPVETTPASLLKNQQIAARLASTGMPAEQYNQAMRNIDRNRNAAISGAKDRKGGLALTSAIQQQSDDATGDLDARNANMRVNNIRSLLGVNSQVANAEQNAFNWNYKMPYQRDRQYGMDLQAAGNQNIVAGIDSGISAFGNIAGRYNWGGSNYGNAGARQSYTSGGRASNINPNLIDSDYSINTSRATRGFNSPSLRIM